MGAQAIFQRQAPSAQFQRPDLLGSEDMARSRTSVLAVVLAVVAAAALFAGVCSFVGPAQQQQREIEVSRNFFGGPPAPAPAPPTPVKVERSTEQTENELKAVGLVFVLLAFVVFSVTLKN